MFVNTCMCLFSQAPTQTLTHARTRAYDIPSYPCIFCIYCFSDVVCFTSSCCMLLCASCTILYDMCYYGGNYEYI